MSDISQAQRELHLLAGKLRPLLALDDLLTQIGDLDAAAASATRRAQTAKDAEASAVASLQQANGRLTECNSRITEAIQQAAKVSQDAQTDALDTAYQAWLEGEAIIAQALTEVRGLQADFKLLCEKRDTTRAKVTELTQELEAIRKQIAAAKASVAALG